MASVEVQTLRDWEIVVADDGSTDHTAEVCSRIGRRIGERFHYHRCEHRGASAARNTAIAASIGEFVAFLDSDDEFYPEKLSILTYLLKHNPDTDLAFSSSRNVGFYESGKNGFELPKSLLARPYPELLWLRNNVIMTPSVIARRSAVEQSGGFDETMAVCEDIDLWRRILRHGKAVAFSRPLAAIHTRQAREFLLHPYLSGRVRLYEKAFREDPNLPPDFKRDLCLELLSSSRSLAFDHKQFDHAKLLHDVAAAVASADDDGVFALLHTLLKRFSRAD